jgi:hypothetical protein
MAALVARLLADQGSLMAVFGMRFVTLVRVGGQSIPDPFHVGWDRAKWNTSHDFDADPFSRLYAFASLPSV